MQGISLIPKHIKGVLNVLADKGSRSLPIETEWSLDRDSFMEICEWVGLSPTCDLFATCENSHCEIYVSPCPDSGAWTEDTFSVDWNTWDSIYVFPSGVRQGDNKAVTLQGEGVCHKPPFTIQALVHPPVGEVPPEIPLPEGSFLSQSFSTGTIVWTDPFALAYHIWIL